MGIRKTVMVYIETIFRRYWMPKCIKVIPTVIVELLIVVIMLQYILSVKIIII